MKICSKCNIAQHVSNFTKKKDSKDGFSNICKVCKKKYDKERRKDTKFLKKEKERLQKYDRKEYLKNWRFENRKHIQLYEKTYRLSNRSLLNSKNARWRAARKQACPSWADLDKIKVLYEKAKWLESLTGLKYHVDHIIPLQGENVCGLHCWNNLQILEQSVNCSKGNK